MERPRAPEAVVVVASIALLGGTVYGAFQTRSAPTGPDVVTGTTVDIRDFRFDPQELHLTVGGTVTWTNQDSAVHTVKGPDDRPAKSADLAQGDTYEFTFDEAGELEYVCTIHASMKAVIVVEAG